MRFSKYFVAYWAYSCFLFFRSFYIDDVVKTLELYWAFHDYDWRVGRVLSLNLTINLVYWQSDFTLTYKNKFIFRTWDRSRLTLVKFSRVIMYMSVKNMRECICECFVFGLNLMNGWMIVCGMWYWVELLCGCLLFVILGGIIVWTSIKLLNELA